MCGLILRQGPEGRLLNVSPARKEWVLEGKTERRRRGTIPRPGSQQSTQQNLLLNPFIRIPDALQLAHINHLPYVVGVVRADVCNP